MKHKLIILLTIFMAIGHITFSQNVEMRYNHQSRKITLDTLSEERAEQQRLELELQVVCDSLELNYQTKALIYAFAKVRTKDFTSPCCKYNNIFNANYIVEGEPFKVFRINGKIAFPSVYDAVLNLCGFAIQIKFNECKKKGIQMTDIEHNDYVNALLFITQKDITSQEEEIKETYLFAVEAFNPETLKNLLKKQIEQLKRLNNNY